MSTNTVKNGWFNCSTLAMSSMVTNIFYKIVSFQHKETHFHRHVRTASCETWHPLYYPLIPWLQKAGKTEKAIQMGCH